MQHDESRAVAGYGDVQAFAVVADEVVHGMRSSLVRSGLVENGSSRTAKCKCKRAISRNRTSGCRAVPCRGATEITAMSAADRRCMAGGGRIVAAVPATTGLSARNLGTMSSGRGFARPGRIYRCSAVIGRLQNQTLSEQDCDRSEYSRSKAVNRATIRPRRYRHRPSPRTNNPPVQALPCAWPEWAWEREIQSTLQRVSGSPVTTARRRHAMPFGAELRPDGATRFRLWAPAASQVRLLLTAPRGRAELPMTALDGGWHECLVSDAPAGSLYAFRLEDGTVVPDPASRANPADVHAPSMVVDPLAFAWQDVDWRGRPWEQAVIYELHVGTFTPQGSFAAVIDRLDDLVALGITALELMPVAEFPGRRSWGYDGVLLFAPDAAYGTPEELKRLVQAAHARGLMMLLDVVYNHFGPDGNYLHLYAPQFFATGHTTPWGAAINFDGRDSRTVRDFFIHNALYWIEEFRFDGLRLDAVHAIRDAGDPDIVAEIAAAIAAGPGSEREVHLVLENVCNETRYLERDARSGRPRLASAQWNDDAHHALHVLVTGETHGRNADYADAPLIHLGRALAEGFAYQGEPSRYRGGARRGEASGHVPATAFVAYLQSHDQVGNRVFGERLSRLAPEPLARAALACVALAPQIPMLFMGEEFAASTPFLFFCDFEPTLGAAVTRGRLRDLAHFPAMSDPVARARMPAPNDEETFAASKLCWEERSRSPHREHLRRTAELLALRRRHIMPRLAQVRGSAFEVVERALHVQWTFADGARLHLVINFAPAVVLLPQAPRGQRLYADGADLEGGALRLAQGGVIWILELP